MVLWKEVRSWLLSWFFLANWRENIDRSSVTISKKQESNLWITLFRAKSPQDTYVWQDSAKNSGSGHLPNYWLSVFSGFTAGFYMNANGIILARKVRPYNNPFIKWNDDWHHIFETKRLKRPSISKAAQSIAIIEGVSHCLSSWVSLIVFCILGSSTTFLKL